MIKTLSVKKMSDKNSPKPLHRRLESLVVKIDSIFRFSTAWWWVQGPEVSLRALPLQMGSGTKDELVKDRLGRKTNNSNPSAVKQREAEEIPGKINKLSHSSKEKPY